MLSLILVATGLVAITDGCWRGYAAARAAMLPFAREGDPTRLLVESVQPIHARPRVRLAARHGLLAAAWITVAMYGMYLVTVGVGVHG